MPVVAIDHPGRAFLALALLARYEAGIDAQFAEAAKGLLGPEQSRAALVTGLALRLASPVSVGSTELLSRTRIVTGADWLVLLVPDEPAFVGDVVRRRLHALGAAHCPPRSPPGTVGPRPHP